MANVTISQLPTASALTGSESVPIVQNGVTVQTTTGSIAVQPTQTQTFLTVGQQSSLTNSRSLSTATGLSLTDGGAQGTYTIAPSGALASLISSGSGIQVKTGASTLSNVTITASGTGLTVTNGNGVSGNPTISLSTVLQNLVGTSGTGLLALSGTTIGAVSVTGTSGQISVANGSTAPVISLASTSVTAGSYTLPTVTFDAYGRATSASSSSTTGSGAVVLATSGTLTTPIHASYDAWTSITAPAYTEGLLWYDSVAHALAYYNDSSAAIVHIGQDLQLKVINNTGSTIPNGSPVYITGTSSGQTYPNVALAKADVSATSAVIGLTNGAIPNGSIGYVTANGGIDNVNTGTFTVGQVLYLSPYSAGQLMNTIPPTGITVQVGVVSYVNSSVGKIYVRQTTPLAIQTSILVGAVAVANGGTGFATTGSAPTIASAATIAPTKYISFVSGTTTISTITAPSALSTSGGQITLIPTGLWSTTTGGNISLASTAVVSKALTMTYDSGTALWYPSY